jgi:uncharacterized membrane protein
MEIAKCASCNRPHDQLASSGTIGSAARSRTQAFQVTYGGNRLSIANPRSTMQIFRRPIHPMLVRIPIACFVGVLLTDLTYWWSAEMMWADFSAWLVSVGVIFGVLAAVFGLIDFVGGRSIRAQPPAWPHAIGNVVLLILATLNMFVHSRDAWTSVVPWGVALSAATVLILLFTVWMGQAMVYRHGVGVAE